MPILETFPQKNFLEVLDKPLPLPQKVLMCAPDFFDVLEVKNPHMEGNIGKVNYENARNQWEMLRQTFLDQGLEVELLEAVSGLDDMVFTANQGLAFLDSKGKKRVLMGKMRASNRQGEIAPARSWFRSHGYETVDCLPDEDDFFEGNGDALWHRGKRLLIMAHGVRSSQKSLEKIGSVVEAATVTVRLTDAYFYHMDTCLSILDEESAMILPEAFDEISLEILQKLFPRLISIPIEEAVSRLAVNAFCMDKKRVIMNSGVPQTRALLKQNGFEPIEVDTSEFGKSGGSVFCMKLAFF